MKLKEFINEDKVYTKVEDEIREWVEKTYNGLSIVFEPHLEIVRTNAVIDFDKEQVYKITEVVNIKIGDIMEAHAEEIFIAEKLTKIWKNHPRFNIEVENIEDVKKHPLFLKYLKDLTIRTKANVVNIQDYRRKENAHGERS